MDRTPDEKTTTTRERTVRTTLAVNRAATVREQIKSKIPNSIPVRPPQQAGKRIGEIGTNALTHVPRTRTRTTAASRRALTLVELSVSMMIMSILTVGLASAILLASKALPNTNRNTYKIMTASHIADQLITELQEARHITEQTDTAVTFTVADRDGDGSPETIRYAWSGTAGDPLTRTYNQGATATILDNVSQFALIYEMKDDVEIYPGPLIEGAEVLLSSYNGSEERKNFNVNANNWIGQYFNPTPEAGAVSWKVTRVKVKAKKRGATDGETFVQLREANMSGLPSDTILEQKVMYESTLGNSFSWQEFAFSHVAGLRPGEGLSLVLKYSTGGSDSARIKYDSDGGINLLNTDDAGASWNLENRNGMLHYFYGKWSTLGPDQNAVRQYVTGIRINLQSDSNAAAAIETGVRMLNTPEVLSAVWEVDFDTNPTMLNMNGDGSDDWMVTDGSAFDPATLSGGVWYADTAINTTPNNNFTALTTVDVRFRNTNPGSNAAYFLINADWAASLYAPIAAMITLQPDATQTIIVKSVDSEGAALNLVTISGLPNDFATLRLLIDPSLGTVNIRANDVNYGTYLYGKTSPLMDHRFVSIMPVASNAEFDSISVRVKGTP